jgi:hypothetical protein
MALPPNRGRAIKYLQNHIPTCVNSTLNSVIRFSQLSIINSHLSILFPSAFSLKTFFINSHLIGLVMTQSK